MNPIISIYKLMGIDVSINLSNADEEDNQTIRNRDLSIVHRDYTQTRQLLYDLQIDMMIIKNNVNVLEYNVKIVTKICSEPKIRNTAVQIMNHCFNKNKLNNSPSKRFYAASSIPENTHILATFTSLLDCKLDDIDNLIQVRNKENHMSETDLDIMVSEVNEIIAITPEFSNNLEISLHIIKEYETFKQYFGKLSTPKNNT